VSPVSILLALALVLASGWAQPRFQAGDPFPDLVLGPRLDKPYAFYDWVPGARQDFQFQMNVRKGSNP